MNLIKKVGIADNKLLLHNFGAISTDQHFLSGCIPGIKDYVCARERLKLLNIQVTLGSEWDMKRLRGVLLLALQFTPYIKQPPSEKFIIAAVIGLPS